MNVLMIIAGTLSLCFGVATMLMIQDEDTLERKYTDMKTAAVHFIVGPMLIIIILIGKYIDSLAK